jgi:hypothetical protein
MSEWYPSTTAPKSSLTTSPRRSARSVGWWWGSAACSPNAAIVSPHRDLELERELALGDPLAEAAAQHDRLEGGVRRFLCPPDRGHLLRVLDAAQLFDLRRGGNELDTFERAPKALP